VFGGSEVTSNSVLLILCYLYIVLAIFVSIKLGHRLHKDLRRKFLHIMIGNFVYVIPFFTFTTFPVNFPFFVAFPFILLTLLASPFSPINFKGKIAGLADISSSGHGSGLLFYAISYTVLAFFFSDKPYVMMAGILPMAFGDAAASIVGKKVGRHKLSFRVNKSFEGSAAMFLTTLISIICSLLLFSYLWPFSLSTLVLASFGVAVASTVLEALTPKGLDNLAVPLSSALLFLVLIGGV
jgi:phytol kinase